MDHAHNILYEQNEINNVIDGIEVVESSEVQDLYTDICTVAYRSESASENPMGIVLSEISEVKDLNHLQQSLHNEVWQDENISRHDIANNELQSMFDAVIASTENDEVDIDLKTQGYHDDQLNSVKEINRRVIELTTMPPHIDEHAELKEMIMKVLQKAKSLASSWLE